MARAISSCNANTSVRVLLKLELHNELPSATLTSWASTRT
jgi:hypothetical protein